nr:MAG TPA: hypothetical protein [Bacteriophage sp.]
MVAVIGFILKMTLRVLVNQKEIKPHTRFILELTKDIIDQLISFRKLLELIVLQAIFQMQFQMY